MITVNDVELEQKISEFMVFAREFAIRKEKKFVFKGKREKFKFSIFDKDVTLEFSL